MAERAWQAAMIGAVAARRKRGYTEPVRVSPSNWALLAIHLAGSLAFLLSRASGTNSALVGLPLDDAWIHLVYARSLAEHLSFTYNPGAWEAGMTSPLWCLLAAPLVRLTLWFGLPAPIAVKLLGIAVAWITSCAIYSMALRWTGSRFAAWCAALLPALEPNLAFARVSGMEVWLATLGLVTALWFASDRAWGRAGFAAGLGIWARPEQALWALLLPLVLRAPRRSLLRYIAPVLAAAGAWSLYCLMVTGRPLPNTFYAKWSPVSGSDFLLPWLNGVRVHFVDALASFRWGGGLVLAGAGIWRLARGHGRTGLALLLAGYPLLFALAQSRNGYFFTPSATFAFDRYYEPCAALLLLLAGIGAGHACQSVARGVRSPVVLLLASALIVALAGVPGRWVSRTWLYSWNTRNIEDLQVEAGRWLRERGEAGALAVNDAGAMRFFGGRPVVDLAGLNTHELSGVDGLPVSTLRLLEEWQVSTVAVLPFWYPQFERMPAAERVREFRAPHYTLKSDSGWDQLVVLRFAGGFRAAGAAPYFVEDGDRLRARGTWEAARLRYADALACAPEDTAAARRLREMDQVRDRAESRASELSRRASALGIAEEAELADLSFRLGREVEAEAHWNAAASRLSTPDDRARLTTARVQLLVQHGKGPDALGLLHRAVRRDRGQPLLLLQLGKLATQGHRYREAARAYEEVLRLSVGPEIRTLAENGLAEIPRGGEHSAMEHSWE